MCPGNNIFDPATLSCTSPDQVSCLQSKFHITRMAVKWATSNSMKCFVLAQPQRYRLHHPHRNQHPFQLRTGRHQPTLEQAANQPLQRQLKVRHFTFYHRVIHFNLNSAATTHRYLHHCHNRFSSVHLCGWWALPFTWSMQWRLLLLFRWSRLHSGEIHWKIKKKSNINLT